MTRRFYSNTAPQLTLTAGISNAATTCTVSAAPTGWPVSFPYFAAFEVGMAGMEIVLVTGTVGSTLTITRGQDGTSAVSHASGATVDHVFAAKDLDEPNAHIQATTGVHGISGTLVGTTDAQSLSAKTLVAPVVTGGVGITGAVAVTGTVTASGLIHATTDLTVDGTLTAAGQVLNVASLGAVKAMSMDPLSANGNVTPGANVTWFGRVIAPGSWSVSAIGFNLTSVSGNVSVAVLRDNGSGVPGTIAAQSASIAGTTAATAGQIALGSTITVSRGDWIAVTTAGGSLKGSTGGGFVARWRACQAAGFAPGALTSNPAVTDTTLGIALWGV